MSEERELTGLEELVSKDAPWGINHDTYPIWKSYEASSSALTPEMIEEFIRGDWEWWDADGSVSKRVYPSSYVATLLKYGELTVDSRPRYRLREVKMSKLQEFIRKVKKVAKSAVTYVAAAQAVVVVASPKIAEAFPEQAETIGQWTVRVVAVLGGAVVILRRVDEVPEGFRGL